MQESDSTGVASVVTRFGRPEAAPLDGELAFLSPEAQAQRTVELLGAGALVVDVPSPPASMRGRLTEYLDERVERALGVRGAPSPYLASWAQMPDDAAARLADQLFRARTVGATGLALAMGSLAAIAAPALTPEDCAALRALARAAEASPIALLLDDGDAGMTGYAEPVLLTTLLRRARAEARAAEGAEDEPAKEALATPEPESLDLTETVVDAPVSLSGRDEPPQPPIAEVETAALRARRRATVGVPVSGPPDAWRSWAIALNAARGPQPLSAFERLFVESYLPLANAIARGLEDPRAVRAQEEFSGGFAKTYADAFATFGATGRRPRLVMDAFDVAMKQARLHNARATHVVLVDAMRYDVGCAVRDQLAERAQGTVSLASESLLWSALPTTTYRQLETLARGVDALRAPSVEDGSESLRGRSPETVRRLRVGSRELYRLELVPAMLGALPGVAPDVVGALDGVGASVADALLRHIETLSPRTLLLVLGDHGFSVDRRGLVSEGGASPEEVLVPCLSYLVGELH